MEEPPPHLPASHQGCSWTGTGHLQVMGTQDSHLLPQLLQLCVQI